MSEEWRPVAGTDGRYEISSLARLRKHFKYRSTRIQPGWRGRHGYWLHAIDGRHVFRHVLVATAFHGERQPGQVCRHLNGVPGDDLPHNLAWGTMKENAEDSKRHGTNWQLNQTHCKWGHEFTETNTFIDNLNRRICRTCKHRHSRRDTERVALERARAKYARRRMNPRRTVHAVLADGSEVVCYSGPPSYYREFPPPSVRTRIQLRSAEFQALVSVDDEEVAA